MDFDRKSHWNKSTFERPQNRKPSNYAIDKEKMFPRNSVICDLGGGDGTDSLYFLEKGHKVYLYDISDIGLKRAEESAKKKGFADKLVAKQIDLSEDNIPAEDNFFDVVYSRLSLHYFYPKRIAEILKDVYRILKDERIAYIVVKSPEDENEMSWLKSNTKKLGEGIYSEGGLIKTRFTKEQYRNFLKNAGISNFSLNDYIERFGKERIFVKSRADKLLYIEVTIKK